MLIISILLAVTFKMGIAGIALGTLLAQYLGLSIAIFLFLSKYKSYLSMINIKESLNLKEIDLPSTCIYRLYKYFCKIRRQSTGC